VASDSHRAQPHSVTGLPFDHTVDFFRHAVHAESEVSQISIKVSLRAAYTQLSCGRNTVRPGGCFGGEVCSSTDFA